MTAPYEITYCVIRIKDALDAFDMERDPDHLVSMRKWIKELQASIDFEMTYDIPTVEAYRREDAIHDQHLLEEETDKQHALDVSCIVNAGVN
jgi:hypothetical protein